MEKTRKGSSPPVFLSTDVNEKGTGGASLCAPLSDGLAVTGGPRSDVNGNGTGWRGRGESDDAEEDICMKMLDLVTDAPSGGTVSNCATPKPCTDPASSNVFTTGSVTVGSMQASSAYNALSHEEMDANALPGNGLGACHQPLNGLTGAGSVDSHSRESWVERGSIAASRARPDGLSNGVTDCVIGVTDCVIQRSLSSDAVVSSQIDRNTTPDEDDRSAHGGLLIGYSSARLHTETVVTIISDGTASSDGSATCHSNAQRERPFPPRLSARENHPKYYNVREEPDGAGAQPRTQTNAPADLPEGATGNRGLLLRPAPGNELTLAGRLGDDLSSRALPPAVRPRTMTSSLSYDSSAVLSPGERGEDGEKEGELVGPGDRDLRFMDVSLCSRNTFESSRRQSAPGHIPEGLSVPPVETSALALQSKRPGIADYFGRSLFSKKQREPKGPSQNAPGWKLFGKVPARDSPPKDPRTIQQESIPGCLTSVSTPNLLNTGEYESRVGKAGHGATSAGTSPTQPQQARRKNLEFEPLSTTALILENRPANLPAKSVEEAMRHRQEYDEMVAEAKKRELREAQRKRKEMKERFKQEDSIANAMVVWNNDILPNWENMRNSRRARELWWQGLPPNVRGKVWSLAIGNELNITPELYEIFLSRAKERWRSFSEMGSDTEADDGASLADRESSLELIKLDISRTFPPLFIFQKGGPYHDLLHSVLGAYTCYRPDVGYVQGMSFIAAVLILNLTEADAFIAFANLLNKPCQLAFFRVDHDLMLKYFAAFEVFFEENLPKLFNHFLKSNLTPDLYLIDWIFTLYSKSLPLDVACRVWDVFCRDGEEFLFRTGLGILRLYEDVLLQMDFIHSAQFLTRLPEDIASDRLFACIAATPMLTGNRKWSQVFNALIKDTKDLDKN
ncbi:hypothetical protein DPEC_G00329460 [Dallia pectoralis]|uniref:Uncharacterized protein n=1 Tax=Dallia pectoralis TaxID=75939 RepID=A0ACC2F8W2_DALPE|nr:hypothetical protein DPEC_G00329460 [Dallia pectoralis]